VADAGDVVLPLGHGVWLDSGELEKAFRVRQAFARKRAEMERSGAVDKALARAEPGDWGPRSAFENRIWEFLAALLKLGYNAESSDRNRPAPTGG
jgi:hypothetical protein